MEHLVGLWQKQWQDAGLKIALLDPYHLLTQYKENIPCNSATTSYVSVWRHCAQTVTLQPVAGLITTKSNSFIIFRQTNSMHLCGNNTWPNITKCPTKMPNLQTIIILDWNVLSLTPNWPKITDKNNNSDNYVENDGLEACTFYSLTKVLHVLSCHH